MHSHENDEERKIYRYTLFFYLIVYCVFPSRFNMRISLAAISFATALRFASIFTFNLQNIKWLVLFLFQLVALHYYFFFSVRMAEYCLCVLMWMYECVGTFRSKRWCSLTVSSFSTDVRVHFSVRSTDIHWFLFVPAIRWLYAYVQIYMRVLE